MTPQAVPADLIVTPDFFPEVGALRHAYEARFARSYLVSADRFVWDYWYVEGRYAYLRTHARRAFPAPLFDAFLAALRSWGARRLGCAEVSDPWLSYYIDGCRQELHTDLPQGPWAYVFSLTRWEERRFQGGETMFLREEPGPADDPEAFLRLVPAPFNQLLVFDPRAPHGVRPVEGTRDPLFARVVIHGWFREPSRVLPGPASRLDAEGIDRACATLQRRLKDLREVHGVAAARVDLGPGGEAAGVTFLTDRLAGAPREVDQVRRAVREVLGAARADTGGRGPDDWFVVPVRLPVAEQGAEDRAVAVFER
jgi:hypothetical protein